MPIEPYYMDTWASREGFYFTCADVRQPRGQEMGHGQAGQCSTAEASAFRQEDSHGGRIWEFLMYSSLELLAAKPVPCMITSDPMERTDKDGSSVL